MRGVYLRRLVACLDDLRREGSAFFAEAAMPAADGLAREGPLSLPFRCDALVVSRDGKSVKPTLFEVERHLDFSPQEFEGGGVEILLSSCHWEAVQLTIWGEPARVAAATKAWFEAAFEPPEQRDEDQIQEVAHDISGFVANDEITTFVADFGTMPVAQVFALFDRLRDAGATRVELSMR